MTKQSINSIEDLLFFLTNKKSKYYIEKGSIASKSEVNGHTIYSRYKCYSGKISSTLITQHLKKEINLAISLDSCSIIVFEYYGKYQEAFASLLSYFLKDEIESNLYISTVDSSKIILFFKVNLENCDKFTALKEKITKKLEDRQISEFKVLPSSSYPDIGNLLKLPRELIVYGG